MLVNRDETNPHTVRVQFEDSKSKQNASFSGPVTFVTFGSEQYVWINDGPKATPTRIIRRLRRLWRQGRNRIYSAESFDHGLARKSGRAQGVTAR